ncbi:MAG: acyltransferase [Alphaproteobacteria bacterium]|nr:acyltransferase [Alphaproteobacteria bacterium]
MASTSYSGTRTYFPYIDGLRALSIITVVLFHLDTGLVPAGFSGVDIFFVISGFVVSASLHGIPFERFRDFVAFFYARRLRRVVPALAVVLVVSSLATTLFVPYAYLSSHIKETAVAAFFGFSNVELAKAANSYFAPRAEYNPFTHTWSLGVEEQFYLVFPFLYYAFLKSRRSWTVSLICLLCLIAGSIGYCFVEDNATHKFYMIFGRFWELGTGVCLYLLLEHDRGRAARSSSADENLVLSWLGAAVIGAGLFLTESTQYPWPGGLMAVGGTALVVLGLHGRRPRSWVGRLLTARLAVAIGLASYSLYLWHWPVFAIFRWTIGLETASQKFAALLIAIALSLASYQLVERPFRTSRLLRAPWIAIPGIALFAGCCVGASLLIYGNVGTISRSVVMQHRGDWYSRTDLVAQRADSCNVEITEKSSAGLPVVVITPKSCEEWSPGFTLFVIGDSHADAYAAMLTAYASAARTRVVTYASLGCPTIEFVRIVEVCKFQTTRVLADVRKQAKPGDIVFISSLTVPRLREQWSVEHVAIADNATRQSVRGVRREAVEQAQEFLGNVLSAGVQVVFELPKPIFPTPLFRCSDWFNRTNPICRDGQEISRELLEQYRLPVMQTARIIREKLKGFHLWDPFVVLCPDASCRMTRDGKPLYFDGDHISGFGNRILLPSFSAMIDEVRRAAPER